MSDQGDLFDPPPRSFPTIPTPLERTIRTWGPLCSKCKFRHPRNLYCGNKLPKVGDRLAVTHLDVPCGPRGASMVIWADDPDTMGVLDDKIAEAQADPACDATLIVYCRRRLQASILPDRE